MRKNGAYYFASLVAIGLQLSTSCPAKEIDVSAELAKKIMVAHGNFHDSSEIPSTCSPDGSWHMNFPFQKYMRCTLSFQNLHITSTDIVYSDPTHAALPETSHQQMSPYYNCTDETQSINDSISVTVTEGVTVGRTTTVSERDAKNMGWNAGLNIGFVHVGANGSNSVDFSTGSSDSTSQTLSQGKTISEQIKFDLKPHTVHQVTLIANVFQSYVKVRGNLVIDGDVYMIRIPKDGKSWDLPFGIPVYEGKASALAPNEKDRTIFVDGEIWNTKTDSQRRVDTISALPVDSEVCKNFRPAVSSDNDAKNSDALRAEVKQFSKEHPNMSKTDSKDVKVAQVEPAQQVTEPIVDGMTITTAADIAGNVSVRAQSMGPGFCKVAVTSNQGNADIVAPPGQWSDWTTLFSPIGKVSAALGTRVDCDTGALFEVQYWK